MNVLWIVVDTLRSDHLSCYGYFRKTSPNGDYTTAAFDNLINLRKKDKGRSR